MKILLLTITLLFSTSIMLAATPSDDKRKRKKNKKEDLTLYEANHIVTVLGRKKTAPDGDIICRRSRKICVQLIVEEAIPTPEGKVVGGIGLNTDGIENTANFGGGSAVLNIYNEEGTITEEQFTVQSYSIKTEQDENNEEVIRISFDEDVQTLLFSNVKVKGVAKLISSGPNSQMIRCKGRKGECVTGTSTGIETKFSMFKQRNESGSITPGSTPSLTGLKGKGGVFKVNGEEIKAESFSIKETTDTDGEPVIEIDIIKSK